MLEVILLFVLGKRIHYLAQCKGRSGWPYVLMLIGFWFGGEMAGAIGGTIITLITSSNGEPNLLIAYLGALAGAACGAVISFVIVNALPPVEEQQLPEVGDDRPGL